MQNLRFLPLVVLMLPSILKADVIYTPHTGFGTALSFELVGSYELHFSKLNTINLWGGFGAVSMISELRHPGLGAEMAIEVRQYFKRHSFKNLNLGLYAGLAYMKHPYFYNDHLTGYSCSVGFVPGLKLTYKKRINSWLVGEPYVGVSTPWYGSNFKELSNFICISDPGLVITFGIRVGFNKVRFG